MIRSGRSLVVLATMLFAMGVANSATAQGLLWSIPEDGTWVKYTGVYKNKEEQPGNNAGALELDWLSELTIQSVGEEMGTYKVKGKDRETLCRWIEFKVVTGSPSAGGVEAGAAIDPGPFGTRIYRVLVPIESVTGQLKDADGLPVTHIPIVKGVRKLGRDAPVEPIKEKVLAFYPVLGMFANYLDLAAAGEEAPLELAALGSVKAKALTGTLKQKNAEMRTENVGQIWLSADVPFGWAKYQVKLTRQRKSKFAPESEFAPAAEIEVEMAAVEKGTGAKSELGDATPAAATPAAETPAAETKDAAPAETKETTPAEPKAEPKEAAPGETKEEAPADPKEKEAAPDEPKAEAPAETTEESAIESKNSGGCNSDDSVELKEAGSSESKAAKTVEKKETSSDAPESVTTSAKSEVTKTSETTSKPTPPAEKGPRKQSPQSPWLASQVAKTLFPGEVTGNAYDAMMSLKLEVLKARESNIDAKEWYVKTIELKKRIKETMKLVTGAAGNSPQRDISKMGVYLCEMSDHAKTETEPGTPPEEDPYTVALMRFNDCQKRVAAKLGKRVATKVDAAGAEKAGVKSEKAVDEVKK